MNSTTIAAGTLWSADHARGTPAGRIGSTGATFVADPSAGAEIPLTLHDRAELRVVPVH